MSIAQARRVAALVVATAALLATGADTGGFAAADLEEPFQRRGRRD